MDFDPMKHLKEMMRIRGVGVHVLTPPYRELVRFDFNLRERLYGEYDYGKFIEYAKSNCKPNTVYLMSDQFELRYIIFRDMAGVIVVIGPYAVQDSESMIRSIRSRMELPVTRETELGDYLSGIPVLETRNIMESEVMLIVKYIFDTDSFDVERIDFFTAAEVAGTIIEAPDDHLPMAVLEERYQNEDDLLEAVMQGDIKKATLHMSMFSRYRMLQRHADSLRSAKNYLFVFNTLLRRAVRQAAVHPAHIHNVSSSFAMRIENVRTQEELNKLTPEMIRKYCMLVNNHSLRNYSLPVRKAVNFIDFNFTQQLTLEMVADAASVNFSYLSSQFKKETGSSVIEYVNMKRMQKSLTLLAATKLSIGEIAEKSGFSDDNYFTRIFKKTYGKSPREYRKELQIQQN